MKTVFNKIILLFLVTTMVVLAQPSPDIVGSWLQDGQGTRWTFRPDGTGFMEQGQPKTTARFEWRISGTVLEVSTAGRAIPYELLQNDGSRLVIKNQRVAQVYELRRD